MNYITIPDFELMLGLQLTTNQAYAGKNWKGKATIAKYAMAAEREFSEFADEINEKWHWWAKEKRFELNKALIEFCDYVCFSLSMVFYFQPRIELLEYTYDRDDKLLGKFDLWYKTFVYNKDWRVAALDPDKKEVVLLAGLLNEINTTLEFLGVSKEDFLDAFKKVSERNIQRGKNGALQGVDVKSKEQAIVVIKE